MFAHPILLDISIGTYKQKRLCTLMLADGVYITFPLNLVNVEGISNISTRKTLLDDKKIYR